MEDRLASDLIWLRQSSWFMVLLKDSGKFPCSIFCDVVGKNSIHCTHCEHRLYDKLTGKLRTDPEFLCPRCSGLASSIDGWAVTELVIGDKTLALVDEFCNLCKTLYP